MDEPCTREVARRIRGHILVRVSCRTADPEDDAAVLEGAVGVQKSCTDRADLGPHCVRDHLVEPAGLSRLKVVIQETEHAAARMTCREIVDGGEIERSVIL